MMIAWMPVLAPMAAATDGTANIPVEDLLALHRPTTEVPAPPVAGALDELRIVGSLLDDALDVTVEVRATVLAQGPWTAIPLLEVEPSLSLAALPELDGGWLVVQDGVLTLLGRTAKTHRFTLRATVSPEVRGPRREARLRVRPATSGTLELTHDSQLIELLTSRRPRRQKGGYSVAWRATNPAVASVAPVAPRVAEPTVTAAHSTVVSTLEGTWLTRTHYALSFEGRRPITLSWPQDQELRRLYVNGVPLGVEPEGHQVTVEVTPARGGGDVGTLEVVLAGARTGYLLQGTLPIELPGVSWPVTAWQCDTHLPEVFNYSWQGGSMQPLGEERIATPESFAYALPTPGTPSRWGQELVYESPPRLRLDYAVNLEGAYFRVPPPSVR